MRSNKNFLFEAFDKIVMKPCHIVDNDSKVVVESESLKFITLNTVNLDDAPHFVKYLERLVEKLDEAVGKIYRYGCET